MTERNPGSPSTIMIRTRLSRRYRSALASRLPVAPRFALAVAAGLPLVAGPSMSALAGTATYQNGSTTSSWSLAGNWTTADGTALPPNAATAAADFSTLDLSAAAAVTLDGTFTANSLKFGDAGGTVFGWTLSPGTATPTPTLTLAGTTPGIQVVSSTDTATIGAVLAGTVGLTKTGAGVLVLNAANTYTGTTTVGTGTLQVGDGTSNAPTARLGSAVTVAAGATLDLYRANGSTLVTAAYTLPAITLQDAAKLRFRSSNGSVTYSTSTAIAVAPAANVTIENNGGNFAHDINLTGALTGSGTINYLASTDAGSSRVLTLSAANSTYTGNWFVDYTAGSTATRLVTLRSGAVGALGTGSVTLGRRAAVTNGVAGGIDSLASVTLSQPTAALDAGPGWAAPAATLTLTAGSAKVGVSATSFGTISVGTLSQVDGSIALDVGASAGDKVVVGGAYGYTGSTGAINVAVVAAPAAGSTLPIVAYGTLAGTPVVNVTGLSSRQTATVNYGSGTNDAISLTFGGSAANLVWTGTNGSAWDVNTTPNFTNVGTGQPDVFLSLDNVTFDDTGSVTSPTLAVTVTPTSVTFNNSVNTYTLGGAGGIGGAATVAKTGTGTVILNNPNTYTGTTTVTGGTLQVGGGGTIGSLGTGTTTIGPAGTVSYFRADTSAVAIATPFAGAGTLVFQGTGTINQSAYSLTGDNSGLTGTVSIQSGARVQASNADAPHFGTATVAVASGGTAYLTGGTFANPFTIAGVGWTETAGNLGAIRLGGGTVSGPVTLAADALISAYGSTGTINGAIGEAGGTRKLTLGTGTSGTITLGGTNTYTGGTDVARTVVNANSSAAFGTGPVTIASPSAVTARIALGSGVTVANPLTINATDPAAGRGVLEGPATGTATWSGPINITANALQGGHFYVGGGTLVLTGGITSSVPVSQRLGNLVVSGGGSYPAFTVTGNLKIGANDGLVTTSALNLGGSAAAVFDLNGFNQTLAGLTRVSTFQADVTNTSTTTPSTFTLNVAAANPVSYPGNVIGNLSLVKAGDGTATLSGTGSYTGTTTISGGTLQIGAAGTTGGIGTGAVTNNAALVVNRTNAVTLANAIGGTGSLTNAGTGVLTLSGANTYTGPTSVAAGGLVVAGSLGATNVTVADGASVGGKGSIAAGGSLTLGTSSGATLAADASTAGALAVGGNLAAVGTTTVSLTPGSFLTPGTPYTVVTYGGTFAGSTSNFTLANPSSFRSATFANTGSAITLDVGAAALTWTGASGTPWDVNLTQNFKIAATPSTFYAGDAVTFDDSAASGNVALTGTIAPSAVVVNNSAVAYSFTNGGSGVLSGSTSLVKRGSGVLTVGGLTNTYTGGTTIAGGEVRVSGAGALGTGTVTLGDATTGANSVALYIDTPTVRTAVANQVIVSSLATGTVTLGSRATTATTGDNNNFANIVLQRDVVFDSNANDRTDYRNITGTGNITITGTSRTTLSGTANANAFVGNVTIATTGTNGYVQVGVVSGPLNLIPDASNVAVNAGAVLRLSTTAEAINALTGGGLVSTNASVAALTVGSANGGGDFSGVMANGSATTPISLVKTGTGTQVLSGISTYTGATTVSNGRLSITGTLGATATTVGSTVAGLTPTLGGTGTVGGSVTLKGPGTSATFLSAGHLAPGNSVGTLTVASLTAEAGSVLDYEFNATANDLTVVTTANGLSLLGGGVNLYAEGTTSAYPFAASGTYHLLQYAGTDPSITGLSVLNPRGDSAYAFQLGTDGGNKYVDLKVSVPEPGTAALLAMAGVGLLSRRRRRA